MLFTQTARFSPFCTTNVDATLHPMSSLNIQNLSFESAVGFSRYSPVSSHRVVTPVSCSVSRKSPSKPKPEPEPEAGSNQGARPKARTRSPQPEDVVSSNEDKSSAETFPSTIPRKPRRGRRSEARAVEDFVRSSLERTFTAIRQRNADALENHENIMKDRDDDNSKSESVNEGDDEEDGGEESGNKMVIEEESKSWPLDADVGWGIRASEYFEKHPIKNVVGEDGYEIDWEGEIDDNWVQEINCLEWESFAFHPSPLIVLVFERYNRATDNWKNLKELEKAVKVYWKAKDRLPPRAVKIDVNIERDLAYALKVRECPQILFLRGNRIVYRENELRTADELVQMIAFFYYNAKKPAWIDDKALYSRY
ncbi:thioredoxin-like fold domain-containing protein MRL7 homolog, chloroplastic [Abrus precatorius]|uniref:Thioredoxin-like fold domain-containing protein MRL7 homolog, chloroplastic n=1 Tax=Abrus precatorius TaxID=3816 RepID=A0A8B8KN69_ABRPR|nr:thioredoxin-like fold domain-containing protein MRL7 homolog, chloroplastic [Abrus precatorius]